MSNKIKSGFAVQFGKDQDLWLHMESSGRKARGLLDVKFVASNDPVDRPTIYPTYLEAVNVARACSAVLSATNPGHDAHPEMTAKRLFI